MRKRQPESRFAQKSGVKRAFGYVLFLCFAFSSLTTPASFDFPRSPDLVFCPLQKEWVKRSLGPIRTEPVLADICAGNQEKESFANRLILAAGASLKIQSPEAVESLFFSYPTKGDRAFTELPPRPNNPDQQLISVKRVQNAGSTNRLVFAAGIIQIFSINRLSRPPTQNAASNFISQKYRDLETISHAIAPRAPPVSL
jgi:hypothetical protein